MSSPKWSSCKVWMEVWLLLLRHIYSILLPNEEQSICSKIRILTFLYIVFSCHIHWIYLVKWLKSWVKMNHHFMYCNFDILWGQGMLVTVSQMVFRRFFECLKSNGSKHQTMVLSSILIHSSLVLCVFLNLNLLMLSFRDSNSLWTSYNEMEHIHCKL